MPASPARATAFDILLAVESEGAFASEMLHSDRLRELSPEDRALCTELVMGTLRWQSSLDLALGRCSSQKIAKLDAEVRAALRLAAYQLALTRVPPRAAVNESVELVKRARKKSAVPFANAVLRKLSSAPVAIGRDYANVTVESLPTIYAHPQWLVSRWVLEYGAATAREICRFDQQVPATSIRLQSGVSDDELRADGVDLAPGLLMRTARRVTRGDITRTKAFAAGRVAIQDEGSQLVAALVGHGSRLLDCCAAPGGKTAALAERNPEATIVATELHPHRARLLRERVPQRVEVLTADAANLPLGSDFDRVLADVPCSGTGTLARNPEIKWKLTREDLADLRHRQIAILRGAMSHVAPGGELVYSSCSLESEENEGVIDEVLRDVGDFSVVDCRERLEQLRADGELAWESPEQLVRGPYLRTIPGIHPCDGFFAAILRRRA